MILSLSNQASIFFLTVIIGLAMGYIFDIFRFIRLIFSHKNYITYIEDILYWLICTGVTAYVLLHNNYLEMRFYCLLGIFIGLIFYFYLISLYIMKLNLYIFKVFIRIVKIISYPIFFILKILTPYFKKVNKRRKIVLQKAKIYGKIKRTRTIETIKIIKNKI